MRQLSIVVRCLITGRVKPAEHADAASSQPSEERANTHAQEQTHSHISALSTIRAQTAPEDVSLLFKNA